MVPLALHIFPHISVFRCHALITFIIKVVAITKYSYYIWFCYIINHWRVYGWSLVRNPLFSLHSPLLTFRSSPIIIFSSRTPSPQTHTHTHTHQGPNRRQSPRTIPSLILTAQASGHDHRVTFMKHFFSKYFTNALCASRSFPMTYSLTVSYTVLMVIACL